MKDQSMFSEILTLEEFAPNSLILRGWCGAALRNWVFLLLNPSQKRGLGATSSEIPPQMRVNWANLNFLVEKLRKSLIFEEFGSIFAPKSSFWEGIRSKITQFAPKKWKWGISEPKSGLESLVLHFLHFFVPFYIYYPSISFQKLEAIV